MFGIGSALFGEGQNGMLRRCVFGKREKPGGMKIQRIECYRRLTSAPHEKIEKHREARSSLSLEDFIFTSAVQ